MDTPVIAALANWRVDFDPYGLMQDLHALAQAPPVEDILQLSQQNDPSRILDLGYYQDRYRLFVIADYDWQQPLAQFEAVSAREIGDCLLEALVNYA